MATAPLAQLLDPNPLREPTRPHKTSERWPLLADPTDTARLALPRDLSLLTPTTRPPRTSVSRSLLTSGKLQPAAGSDGYHALDNGGGDAPAAAFCPEYGVKVGEGECGAQPGDKFCSSCGAELN